MSQKIRKTYAVKTITEQGDGRLNEDSFVAKGNVFAVFDGMTSFGSFTDKEKKTGAFMASNIAREVFEQVGKNLVDLTAEANSKIRKAMIKEHVDMSDKINLWSTSVAAIKLDEESFEWLQISDSIIVVGYNDGTYKTLVPDYDHDEEILTKAKELFGRGEDNPRGLLYQERVEARRRMNVTFGALDGEDYIIMRSGVESLKNVRHIFIFTDGMFLPKSNPREKDDIAALIKIFEERGLEGLVSAVRKLENENQEWGKIRGKLHDDATAIAITFG